MKKVIFLILILLNINLLSYVIYLKDGSTYMAKEKYKIENGKAIITLTNGTIIAIDLNLIDIKKTEEANKRGIDTAVLIDDTKKDQTPSSIIPKQSLGDIIKEKDITNLPKAPIAGGTKAKTTKTKEEGEKIYEDESVRKVIGSVLDNIYLFEHKILQGSGPNGIKIIVTTDNEKDVFDALSAISKAITELYEKGKKSLEVIEIYLATTAGAPAGRFNVEIQTLRLLSEGKFTPQEFFIKYVLF